MLTDEISIIIRPLKQADFDGVLKLVGSLITMREVSSLSPQNADDLSFVAEADGRVVGFNFAHVLYVGIPLVKICVIQSIVVDEDYRRLGIGEKLIETVTKNCAKYKIEAVRALVDETDNRLQRFIEYLGFQRSVVANYDKVIDA
ncbi:MAG TPA: GNAT family N-acetyltransferase [Dehalococcoidales bacterium]